MEEGVKRIEAMIVCPGILCFSSEHTVSLTFGAARRQVRKGCAGKGEGWKRE